MSPEDLDRAFDRLWANHRLNQAHEADQFLAQLHDEIQAGRALGNQCVCGCVKQEQERAQ